MQIILVEDVPNLGNMGETVKVKPGYGRNYLIPRGMAVLATSGNKAHMAHVLRIIDEKREKLKALALETRGQIEGRSVTIARQAGDDDRLFGSVTNRDIEAALVAAGIEVDRKRILLKEPIKALGIYSVSVKLHADVTAEIKVWVAAQ